MQIALVTYAAAPGLTPDDELLADALRAYGASVHVTPWDRPADWAAFDLVVLRSPWDYYLRPAEFSAWIDRLEQMEVRLLNPFPIVRWNGDKRYLFELRDEGIQIVPTVHVPPAPRDGNASPSLAGTLHENGWAEAVVKPVVSAGGHETWRTSQARAGADEARFDALRAGATAGLFVQPFLPEVIDDGEWSFLFVDGEYSHAAIKRPRPGDFLVQHVHGGTYAAATPPDGMVVDAAAVLAAAARRARVAVRDFAYARVDGIARRGAGGDRLVLMELECLEPSLFFLQAPEAAGRMARALVARALAGDVHPSYLG